MDESAQNWEAQDSFIADFLGTVLLKVKVLILSSILISSHDIDNEILHQVHLKYITVFELFHVHVCIEWVNKIVE